MLIDKYKTLVFDLDGTLVHTTAEYRYFIVPETLRIIGKPNNVKAQLIDKFWFDADRNKTIEKHFGCDKNIFWKTFHKIDLIEKRQEFTHAYDDVQDTLKNLKDLGKNLAITTGAPKKIAQMETELIPKKLFTKIISITSTRYKGKPHPESLLGCLRFCKTNPKEAVYIGNSTEDGVYANAAGVDFIYIERREHQFSAKNIYTIPTLFDLFAH